MEATSVAPSWPLKLAAPFEATQPIVAGCLGGGSGSNLQTVGSTSVGTTRANRSFEQVPELQSSGMRPPSGPAWTFPEEPLPQTTGTRVEARVSTEVLRCKHPPLSKSFSGSSKSVQAWRGRMKAEGRRGKKAHRCRAHGLLKTCIVSGGWTRVPGSTWSGVNVPDPQSPVCPSPRRACPRRSTRSRGTSRPCRSVRPPRSGPPRTCTRPRG